MMCASTQQRNAHHDHAVQRRASELLDAGLTLLPALLQAQRERALTLAGQQERRPLVIIVEWFPDRVRLAQSDVPERSIDIPTSEIRPVLAQIVAEVAGEPDTFWDMLAWLEANAKTRTVGEQGVPQDNG